MIQYIDQVLSEKLSRRHGIDLLDGPVTEFPNAEYLIHELAHRETLGVDFVRGVSDRMGHLIKGLRVIARISTRPRPAPWNCSPGSFSAEIDSSFSRNCSATPAAPFKSGIVRASRL